MLAAVILEAAPLISVLVALVAIRKITINECLVWHVYSSHQLPHAPRMGGCHAQTNTPLILDAIVCIFHEALLLPFFFYLPAPKSPQVALAI